MLPLPWLILITKYRKKTPHFLEMKEPLKFHQTNLNLNLCHNYTILFCFLGSKRPELLKRQACDNAQRCQTK